MRCTGTDNPAVKRTTENYNSLAYTPSGNFLCSETKKINDARAIQTLSWLLMAIGGYGRKPCRIPTTMKYLCHPCFAFIISLNKHDNVEAAWGEFAKLGTEWFSPTFPTRCVAKSVTDVRSWAKKRRYQFTDEAYLSGWGSCISASFARDGAYEHLTDQLRTLITAISRHCFVCGGTLVQSIFPTSNSTVSAKLRNKYN